MELLQIFKRNLCQDYIMIDDNDYEKCKNFKWFVKKNRIITNNGILLHQLIFPLKNHDLKYTMTFLDGNNLNYQKQNIEFSHKKVFKNKN